VPVSYFVLGSTAGESVIKTREGWEIKADLGESISEQFVNLQYILKEVGNARGSLKYIDLRYQDRVYWQ
jgi:hypothetical protein